MEQNNFTNIHLQTIGKQIEWIENCLNEIKCYTPRTKTTLIKSPTIIIPHYMKEGIQIGNKESIKMSKLDEFAQEPTSRLQKLSLNVIQE